MDEKTRRELAEIAAQEAALAERKRRLLLLGKEELADAAGLKGAERAEFMGLQPITKSGTIDTMDANTETRSARLSRSRITKKNRNHPFVAAFVAKGETVDAAAKAIGYPRTTVQSWYRSDENARPIPRAAVEKIANLYGVPASTWARITD